MKTTTTETRTARALRLRDEYEAARTPAARTASRLAALRAETFDALRAREADRLETLAAALEEATEAATEAADLLEIARAEYIAARSALRADDLAEYSAADPRALLELCAASVSRAIDRREADTARDGRTLRAKYARLDSAAVLSGNADPMNADAVNEAAARLLDMTTPGGWIDGDPVEMTDRESGDPYAVERSALPLAYVAAIAAGRALDAVMYADGGHRAKLTAKEAREAYRAAADLAPLADRADLLAAEAAENPTEEAKAAAKAARAEYVAASRNFAAAAVVTETRRTVDPVAPSPEAAAIEAERVARVLETVAPAFRENAARVARAIYEGAESIREAARVAGLSEAAARRAWHAVRNAAAVILAEDGETRDLERLIESDRRTREAMGRRREAATVAREADRLAALPAPETSPEAAAAVRAMWADVDRRTRPERLAYVARMSRDEYKAAAALAAAVFHGLAK